MKHRRYILLFDSPNFKGWVAPTIHSSTLFDRLGRRKSADLSLIYRTINRRVWPLVLSVDGCGYTDTGIAQGPNVIL